MVSNFGLIKKLKVAQCVMERAMLVVSLRDRINYMRHYNLIGIWNIPKPLFFPSSTQYFPGIYAMPVAKSGHQLPNPRVLSTRLFQDQPIGSRVLNNMNMQWGQFVTHDMVFQVMEVTGNRVMIFLLLLTLVSSLVGLL